MTTKQIIIIIIGITAILLNIFRKRDYKQQIPLLLNTCFYLFIILNFVIDFIVVLFTFIFYNQVDFINDRMQFYALILYNSIFVFFSIMVWYDNLEGIILKYNNFQIYIIKLIVISVVGLCLCDFDQISPNIN